MAPAHRGEAKERPVRVLHVIDNLSGGGCERWLWDIIRASDPARVVHRVVTVHPYTPESPAFIFARPFIEMGAYTPPAGPLTGRKGAGTSAAPGPRPSPAGRARRRLRPSLSAAWHWLPVRWRHAVGSLGWPATYYPPCYLRALREAVGEALRFRPDIFHAHIVHGLLFGLLLKAVFRRPLLYMVSNRPVQLRDAGCAWFLALYRQFHRQIDRLFIASEYRREWLPLGLPGERTSELKGVVDLAAIDRVRAAAEVHRAAVRGKLAIADEAELVLSVGRLAPDKGHLYGLEAFHLLRKRFPRAHWVVLGEGGQRPVLERRVADLGLENCVHLAGFVPDPLPYYAAADLYFRTPVFEGDTLASCQAMALGVPVVGFNTRCNIDFLPRVGHGSHVPLGDVRALAAAAAEILGLPQRGRDIGRRGAEYAKSYLDIRQSLDLFVGAYLELGQGSGSSTPRPSRAAPPSRFCIPAAKR